MAAACALQIGAAQAVTLGAELTNFRIQVIDLDLADGIAAGYSFSDSQTFVHSTVEGSAKELLVPGWIDELESASTNGSFSSFARATPGGLLATGTNGSTGIGDFFSGAVRSASVFTVQPNTRLVFSADAAISVGDTPCQTACHAFVEFRVGEAIDFQLSTSVGENQSVHINLLLSTTAEEEWKGHIAQQVGVFGRLDPTPPPIPEPETFALLLAGLGLLAISVRRQKGRFYSRRLLAPRDDATVTSKVPCT
jgi:hypothetical protein